MNPKMVNHGTFSKTLITPPTVQVASKSSNYRMQVNNSKHSHARQSLFFAWVELDLTTQKLIRQIDRQLSWNMTKTAIIAGH